MTEAKKPVRVPKQERSRQTRAKLMRAAYKLFGRDGFHGTNAKKIAAAAQVAIGSFYTYFEDKKAIFLELVREHNDEQIARAFDPQQGAIVNPSLEKDSLRGIVEMTLAYHKQDPEFNRQAEALRYSDEDVRRIQEEQDERVVQHLMDDFKRLGEEIRVRDIEAAARVVRIAVIANVHQMNMFDPTIEEDRLIDELVDMVRRYLFHLKV